MEVIKTYQYKLKATKEQEKVFQEWLNGCRFVYNCALEYKLLLHHQYQINATKNLIMKELPEVQKQFSWLQSIHSQTLQEVIERLDKNYQNFFNGLSGMPNFIKKINYTSFVLKQGVKLKPSVSEKIGKVYLPKIGDVDYIKSRNFDGAIRCISIVKKYDGWFINFVVLEETKSLEPVTNQIKVYALSQEYTEKTSEVLNKYEKKMKRLESSIRRKCGGSNNRKKDMAKLEKLKTKVDNVVQDFQHKLSNKLVKENQTILVEKFNAGNMTKQYNLTKPENEKDWLDFERKLMYKSKWYGKEFESLSKDEMEKR